MLWFRPKKMLLNMLPGRRLRLRGLLMHEKNARATPTQEGGFIGQTKNFGETKGTTEKDASEKFCLAESGLDRAGVLHAIGETSVEPPGRLQRTFWLDRGQPDGDDEEASVMNRFRILECRDDLKTNTADQPGNDVRQEPVFRHADGPKYELVKDFIPAIPAVEVKRSNVPAIHYSLGSSGNPSSSDCEHVMKEETWRF